LAQEELSSVSVIIPTYQARRELPGLWATLRQQSLQPQEVLVVDSSSPDGTAELASQLGARVLVIPKEEFNHGLTRTLAGRQARGQVLVYLTQDARLARPDSLARLVSALRGERVAMAYGRQLAPAGMGTLSAMHRLFNYHHRSYVFSYQDRQRFGLRTVFASNSFAAYRRRVLEQIGWFPDLPALEDVHAAARLLRAGYRIAYVAEALVFHAHPFSLKREFQRYLTIGRFYATQRWILEEFGLVEGEGRRYLLFALKHLARKPHLLGLFFLQAGVRYLAYRLGLLLGARQSVIPKRHQRSKLSLSGDIKTKIQTYRLPKSSPKITKRFL